MKVFLQNEEYCRVITVKDSEIDLTHYDDIRDVYTRVEFAGIPVDVSITGDKTDGECPDIDYTAPVKVEAYDEEGDKCYFDCNSPIIQDEHTRELHRITPEELIRQMAQFAVAVMTNPRYIRDFSYCDTGFVSRTEAKHPFIWLVRESGTCICDLVGKQDVSGMLYTMEQYRDRCCLFHFDGLCLRPVTPQAARELLENHK